MFRILDRRVLVDQLVAHRRQVLGHFGAVPVAVVEILFQRPLQDGIEALRQIGAQRGHGRRIGIDDAIDQRSLVIGPKRQTTG